MEPVISTMFSASQGGQPQREAIKKKRTYFGQLSPQDLTGVQGAMLSTKPTPEATVSYYVEVIIPVSDSVPTAEQAAAVFTLANQLADTIRAANLGQLVSVTNRNGAFTLENRLYAAYDETDKGGPLREFFQGTSQVLGNSELLRRGPIGRPATWRARINGSVIAKGTY